jgi:hypothetical protein
VGLSVASTVCSMPLGRPPGARRCSSVHTPGIRSSRALARGRVDRPAARR